MPRLRDQKELGKYLKEVRTKCGMPLTVAEVELKDKGVSCNYSNLARIERGEISVRADILGALCIIYGVSADEVLFAN